MVLAIELMGNFVYYRNVHTSIECRVRKYIQDILLFTVTRQGKVSAKIQQLLNTLKVSFVL